VFEKLSGSQEGVCSMGWFVGWLGRNDLMQEPSLNDRDRWQALVNVVTNVWASQNVGNFLSS
jgi:hypothetical protein